MLKSFYERAIRSSDEQMKVMEFIGRAGNGLKVVDIGCGYGRNLRVLRDLGYDAIGVEVNEAIVEQNLAAGLSCVSVDKFEGSFEKYDVLLMSHIIEHLSPSDLLAFTDRYLDCLKIGGHLVIATPLPSTNFYDDFDHVRPYQPMGFQMAFGAGKAQIQYYSRNKLALSDVWFRRSPWRIRYHRARYVLGPMTRVLQVTDIVGALLFRLSGGLFGRTDGWVGRFEKVTEERATA